MHGRQASPRPDIPDHYKIRLANLARLPILAGSLRGRYWLPANGGQLLHIVLGMYQRDQTARFIQHVRPKDVVYDIGASVGYYTVLSSLLVGIRGRTLAFEPSPRCAAYLRQHVRINSLGNTTVFQAALGSREGTAGFAPGRGLGNGRLAEGGSQTVDVHRLDNVVARERRKPTHLRIDVEGDELQVLKGAQETLHRYRPMVFLSTHGQGERAACCQLLSEMGYKLEPAEGDLHSSRQILCRAA